MKQNRALEASDLFVAEGWQDKLAALALTQLKADLGEDLMLDDPSSINALVIDPARWSFGDQGLEIQFNQYEVAAYATGTPVVTIPWSVLDPMLNPDYGTLLYGY